MRTVSLRKHALSSRTCCHGRVMRRRASSAAAAAASSSSCISAAMRDCIQARVQHAALNAYICETPADDLLRAAAEAQQRVDQGTSRALEGWSVGVKDAFCTTDLPTTAASKMLQGYASPFDATVVQRLRAAGALVVGKTNMDEFSMGSTSQHSAYGPVVNPHSVSRPLVPGGSSGGSAVAVAVGSCRVALGTDTGGSVRLPAAWCGVVGFKPTYGRLSRHGLIAFASSLDTPGVFANNVVDVAHVMDCLAGVDTSDATSSGVPVPAYVNAVTHASANDMRALRIGVPSEYHVGAMSDEVYDAWQAAIAHVRSHGATMVPISLPHTQHALSAYYVLASAEAASNLARYDGLKYGLRLQQQQQREGNGDVLDDVDHIVRQSRSQGFGAEVQRRILTGTFVLSSKSYESYYVQAQRVRQLVARDFDRVWRQGASEGDGSGSGDGEGVDAILTPIAATTAPPLDAQVSPVEEYAMDVCTLPASLAGLPAISVPAPREPGQLPIGIQVIGPQWGVGEVNVMRVGQCLEQGA